MAYENGANGFLEFPADVVSVTSVTMEVPLLGEVTASGGMAEAIFIGLPAMPALVIAVFLVIGVRLVRRIGTTPSRGLRHLLERRAAH